MEICDSVTVMRDGDMIDTKPIEELSIPEIERLMVGSATVYSKYSENTDWLKNPVLIEVKNLTKKNNFMDISFTLRKGEILGITGLLGSGRTELADALFGIAPADSGTISIDGNEVTIKTVRDAVSNGIAYVPEDRLTQGLVMEYSQRDNIILPTVNEYVKNHLLDEKLMTETAWKWVKEIRIKTDDVFKAVKTLSGGNQQKIVIAKWLEKGPKVLILDGPTVGVDVGAKAGIFKTIHEMVEKSGMAVILISDEIRELTANCNRIIVMQNGRLRRVLEDPREIDDRYIQTILEEQKKSI